MAPGVYRCGHNIIRVIYQREYQLHLLTLTPKAGSHLRDLASLSKFRQMFLASILACAPYWHGWQPQERECFDSSPQMVVQTDECRRSPLPKCIIQCHDRASFRECTCVKILIKVLCRACRQIDKPESELYRHEIRQALDVSVSLAEIPRPLLLLSSTLPLSAFYQVSLECGHSRTAS